MIASRGASLLELLLVLSLLSVAFLFTNNFLRPLYSPALEFYSWEIYTQLNALRMESLATNKDVIFLEEDIKSAPSFFSVSLNRSYLGFKSNGNTKQAGTLEVIVGGGIVRKVSLGVGFGRVTRD